MYVNLFPFSIIDVFLALVKGQKHKHFLNHWLMAALGRNVGKESGGSSWCPMVNLQQ